MFICVSCETREQTTDYLYFKLRSLFLRGSVYSRQQFCVERSLYSLRAKIVIQLVESKFQLWKLQTISVECFSCKGVQCALTCPERLLDIKENLCSIGTKFPHLDTTVKSLHGFDSWMYQGRYSQVKARLISLKFLDGQLILLEVADLKQAVMLFLFHRKYPQLTCKNSPFHAKHEVDRTLSQIRITDTSNLASNRSYDHQVCFLNYSTI